MQAAKYFILINAKSGHHDQDETQGKIHAAMSNAQRDYELILIDNAAELEQLARETLAKVLACQGIFVIAGGDGAINAVSQSVAGSGCTFGVLPHGTFNYFSRVHGIPQDTEAALQVLLNGSPEPVQAGLMNDRVFLVNASIGLYPKVLEDRETYKNKYGRSRFIAFISGIISVFRPHRLLRLRLEHEGRIRNILTQTLFIGNNALQMEQVGIPLVEPIEKDQLGAVILKPVSIFKMLGLVIRSMVGKLGEADSVSSFGFRTMTVHSSFLSRYRRVKVATDGEILWLRTPLAFKVWPDALLLIKPSTLNTSTLNNGTVLDNGNVMGDALLSDALLSNARQHTKTVQSIQPDEGIKA